MPDSGYDAQPSRSLVQRRTTLISFLALLGFALAITIYMVLPYVLAIVMGGILSLLFFPSFERLEKRGFGRKIAATLVTLAVVVLVIAPISLFATLAVKQAIAIIESIGESGGLSFRAIMERLSAWAPVREMVGDTQALETQVRNWLQQSGTAISGAILGIVADVPKLVLQLVISILTFFFLLLDGNRLLAWMSPRIPLDSDVRSRVVASFKNTAISVIWATLAAATAQASIMLLAYLALRVPAAFLAGGVTFIFAWIPILGTTPVWLAGAIYLFSQEAYLRAVFMIVFGLVAGLTDNFVRPLVLQGRSKMHPLVSLIAIFGGIGIFGIMGIFVGPILAAVLISLLQIWPAVGVRFGLLPRSEETDKAA